MKKRLSATVPKVSFIRRVTLQGFLGILLQVCCSWSLSWPSKQKCVMQKYGDGVQQNAYTVVFCDLDLSMPMSTGGNYATV